MKLDDAVTSNIRYCVEEESNLYTHSSIAVILKERTANLSLMLVDVSMLLRSRLGPRERILE